MTGDRNGETRQGLVHYRQPAGRWVLLAAVLGSALAFIDATVVNIALPRIGADLRADAAGLQWIINGYTLNPRVAHLAGRVTERHVRPAPGLRSWRELVRGGIAAVWARADVEAVIAARIIQGIGGAAGAS